jgi:hypothetical protein
MHGAMSHAAAAQFHTIPMVLPILGVSNLTNEGTYRAEGCLVGWVAADGVLQTNGATHLQQQQQQWQ